MPEVPDIVLDIPNDELVSRHVYRPRMLADTGVIWTSAFEFPGGQGESLVWRRYVPALATLHQMGCERQKVKLAQAPLKEFSYGGALTAKVGDIRDVNTARGFGFTVRHDPSDGQGAQHVEIAIRGDSKPGKAERSDLFVWLEKVFNQFDSHTCS